LSIHVPSSAKSQEFDLPDMGILPKTEPGPIQVTQVEPHTPAAASGLKAGDAIQSIDGVALHSVESVIGFLQANQGKPVSLVLLRNGKTLPPITANPAKMQDTWVLGFVGVLPTMRHNPLPFGQAISKAPEFCGPNSLLFVDVLGPTFVYGVSVTSLSGRTGIAQVAG